MTNRSDKFNWSDGDVEILNADGTPKAKKTETPPVEKSTVNPGNSDKFSWGPGDVEVLNPDGSKKKS